MRLLIGWHNKLFRIPDFQRAYSWERKQREDLFSDLKALQRYQDPERHHFMATVVCLETSEKEEVGADEFRVYDVVDGQQRLTTLIILLKALAKRLARSSTEEERDAADGINKLLVKRDKRLILLQANHDDQGLFRRYLEDGALPSQDKVKTVADRNLDRAIRECEAFTESWDDRPLSLLRIVRNRLDFILFLVEDKSAVYTIFEVLNSRGLPVDWLDKCKSMLMRIAFEKFPDAASSDHIKELDRHRASLYRTVGLRSIPGHEILRFAATLRQPQEPSKPVSAEAALDFFQDLCEKSPQIVIDVSLQLLEVARELERLYSNRRIEAVTDIAHARLLAVAVAMRQDLAEKVRKEILDVWERITFRVFGLHRKDARTGVGAYTRLAYNICTQRSLSPSDIKDAIEALGKDYPVKEAVRHLTGADWYNRREDDLRYLLYRYEEHLATAADKDKKDYTIHEEERWMRIWEATPAATIEHVYPQQPGNGWPALKKDQIDRYVNRLGNLILLPPGVNSAALNKSFSKKKTIYQKDPALLPRFVVADVLPKRSWHIREIRERESRLLVWIEQTWG
jgi:hypothetical protein